MFSKAQVQTYVWCCKIYSQYANEPKLWELRKAAADLKWQRSQNFQAHMLQRMAYAERK